MRAYLSIVDDLTKPLSSGANGDSNSLLANIFQALRFDEEKAPLLPSLLRGNDEDVQVRARIKSSMNKARFFFYLFFFKFFFYCFNWRLCSDGLCPYWRLTVFVILRRAPQPPTM